MILFIQNLMLTSLMQVFLKQHLTSVVFDSNFEEEGQYCIPVVASTYPSSGPWTGE